MIEWGALLGAMIAAHSAFVADPEARYNSPATALVGVPLFGAVWGACVGAVIHFTSEGVLLGLGFLGWT